MKRRWKRLVRYVLKRVLDWRFRNFRPGARPAHEVRVAGLRLRVLTGVFDPRLHFTSAFLATYLRRPGVVPPGGRVLDLGTGTGIMAITAGLAGAGLVVATDINPAAVRCATGNVLRYGLQHRVMVRAGDLFAPVAGERFDLIVTNPPYYRGEPRTMIERAYMAGSAHEWLARFASGLHKHLTPHGQALVVLGDSADISAILALLEAAGLQVMLVAHRDILVEALYIYALVPTQTAPRV
jgi:release factor glutamine methyltransferase